MRAAAQLNFNDVQQIAKELKCVICFDLFDDPVVTPCNHCFCKGLRHPAPRARCGVAADAIIICGLRPQRLVSVVCSFRVKYQPNLGVEEALQKRLVAIGEWQVQVVMCGRGGRAHFATDPEGG